jgi:hypothetical protein
MIAKLAAGLLCLLSLLFTSRAWSLEFEPPTHPPSHAAGKRLWGTYGHMKFEPPGAPASDVQCMTVSILLDLLPKSNDVLRRQVHTELAEDENWSKVIEARTESNRLGAYWTERQRQAGVLSDEERIASIRQLISARDQLRALEKALYLTDAGRSRATVEAFEFWLEDWARAFKGSCASSKEAWLNDATQEKVTAMTADVANHGDLYTGWFEGFQASNVFMDYERRFRAVVLGDEDFTDTATQARKRAEAAKECAEARAREREAEDNDAEQYGSHFFTPPCNDDAPAASQSSPAAKRLRQRIQAVTDHYRAVAAVRDDEPKRDLGALLSYMDEVASVANQDDFLHPADQWNCSTPQHPGDRLLPRSEINRWKACLSRYMDRMLAYREQLSDRLKAESGE